MVNRPKSWDQDGPLVDRFFLSLLEISPEVLEDILHLENTLTRLEALEGIVTSRLRLIGVLPNLPGFADIVKELARCLGPFLPRKRGLFQRTRSVIGNIPTEAWLHAMQDHQETARQDVARILKPLEQEAA